MAGDTEHKRGYRTIFRSISQVFSANHKHNHSHSHSQNQSGSQNNNHISSSNNNNNYNYNSSSSSSSSRRNVLLSPLPDIEVDSFPLPEACSECQEKAVQQKESSLRARSMLDLNDVAESRLRRQTVSEYQLLIYDINTHICYISFSIQYTIS